MHGVALLGDSGKTSVLLCHGQACQPPEPDTCVNPPAQTGVPHTVARQSDLSAEWETFGTLTESMQPKELFRPQGSQVILGAEPNMTTVCGGLEAIWLRSTSPLS